MIDNDINQDAPMMTQHEVAEYIADMLRVSARVVYDRWVHFPDFPKAKLMPTMVKRAPKRYVRAEIVEWTDRQRAAA